MNAPLHLYGKTDPGGKNYELAALEHCISQCQTGNLREHMRLARTFRPLIRTLAEKRAGGPENIKEINRLCSLGREGLYAAALEYTPKIGIVRFRIFALDFIENAMDSKPKGFWRKIFRHKFPR